MAKRREMSREPVCLRLFSFVLDERREDVFTIQLQFRISTEINKLAQNYE